MAGDLRRTLSWLHTVAQQHDSVLVGVSGGKDSLVTLDLVQSAGFKRVEGFAMHFLPGLRVFDEPVDAAAKRHGILIHRVQHWMTMNMIAAGVFRPHVRELRGQPKLGVKDVWAAMRSTTGIRLIATGERADETIWRRGQMSRCSGWEQKTDRIFPVYDWSERDVVAYLRARKIPVPAGIGRSNMSGIDLRPDTLAHLKKHYPDDYAKILKVFPYAGAQLARQEFLARRAAPPVASEE